MDLLSLAPSQESASYEIERSRAVQSRIATRIVVVVVVAVVKFFR